jgi:hypothetical protein
VLFFNRWLDRSFARFKKIKLAKTFAKCLIE